MSDPAKRPLRVVLGVVLGLVGGALVGLGMMVLLFIVCNVAGGGYNGPNETKLVPLFLYADYAIAILVPLAGTILGVRWEVRRNRPETSSNVPSGPPA